MNEKPNNSLASNGSVATPDGFRQYSEDSPTLRQYTKSKLALASHLRVLREVVRKRGNKARLRQCEELLEKLAEDRFTLAVLGQFKRGKSSLMNAIIGQPLLPVGVLPLTSAITILRYGPHERLLIRRQEPHLAFPEEFPVIRLEDFVTEQGNPGNTRGLKSACLESPSAFLRRGLEFVDTPGIGSAIDSNTMTTLKFLPECDAALFVTSVDSPFTNAELEFLKNVRQYVHKIFFVVNKIDLLGSNERQEVLDFVGATIRREMGTQDVKVFPVSSRSALAAKIEGDWAERLASGLPDLEAAITKFLSGEKESLFLSTIFERTLWILEQESIEGRLHLHHVSLTEEPLVEKWEAAVAEQKRERHRILERVRQRVLSQIPLILMPELTLLIQSQFDGFKKKTDEFLGRAVWRPLWDVWEETEKKALDEVRQNILKWLAEHSEWFRFTSDEIVQSDWNQIQTNLANLTVLAARMFDLELAQIPTAAMFPAWGLEVKFENPFTFNFRCRAQMPACTAILPAWLIRNWWKRRLSKESPQIADKWQEAVIVYATENVLRSFNHLTDGIEVQASEIAGRIMACLRDVENASDNPQTNVEVLNRLRHELTELRGKLLSGDEFADRPRPGGQPNLSPMPSVFANASMSAAVEINFGSDLKTRGCAACEYLAKFTFRLLAQFQGELVDNESIRKNFAEKLGFCPFHLWQLESISSPIGVSLGFSDLADYVSKLFCEKAEEIRTHAHVRFVCDAAKCDCCNLLKVAERDYLQQLAGFVETSEGRAVYAASQGICLQHLRVWLPFLNEDTSRCVLGTTARVFGQLAEDMQSYGLKTETLRRELRNSDENDAYLRAVTHIAGAKNSCMPMNKEVEV